MLHSVPATPTLIFWNGLLGRIFQQRISSHTRQHPRSERRVTRPVQQMKGLIMAQFLGGLG